MKKIFNISAWLAIGTVLFGSCDGLDREYRNGPSSGTFPANAEEVQAGVFATYKKLSDFTSSSTPYVLILDNISDIGSARIATANYTNAHFLHTLAASNSLTTKWYTQAYKLIARANAVLDNIDNIKDQLSEEEYSNYKGEAIICRDFAYELLCEWFGDVPFIDHTLTVNDIYDRASRDSIISVIIDKDMDDDMIEMMTPRHEKSLYGTGRIGGVAAYGLKARFCLNWGRYEDAAKYADKAISLAADAGYVLSTYDTSFCGEDYTAGEPSVANVFGIEGQADSDEMIWCIQFNTTVGNTHNAGYYMAHRPGGGCSYWSPSQSFIDAIQCSDGKSVTESPLYDWQNPFKNRDPRLDLFCVRNDTRVFGFQFSNDPDVKKILNYNLSADGKSVSNSEATGSKSEYGSNGKKGPCGYLWRKYTDVNEYTYNGKYGSSSICELNVPIMRLAELYLIRAESNIEANLDLDLARSDINRIRARASMPEITVTSQADLRSALRYERMVELCDEGFRWFDIRRWGLAAKHLRGTFYAPALNGDKSNARPAIDENWHVTYDGTTWDGKEMNLRTFMTYADYDTSRDDLWPIPQDELDANPHMKQNNGY